MKPRMIMIGGWTDIFEKAKACGFDLTLVHQKSDLKARDYELADQVLTSPISEKVVVDLAATLHQHKPFDVAISFSELGLLNASLIKEKLGIAGNPVQPVLLTRDKIKMRQHLQNSTVPSVPFAIVENEQDIVQLAQQCGWPIILKPANGVGSRQIHKLNAASEIAPALASIRQDESTANLIKYDFPEMQLIAEKFIEGSEVSVEAISWNGQHTVICVTDKLTTGFPYFVECGHSMPSALPDATIAALEKITVAFLDAIGHQHGPSHTEVIISENGPIIVESHTRTGGDRIFEMVDLAFGVDMFSATMQGFSGQFPTLSLGHGRGAAIRYFTVGAGEIRAIEGVEQAKNSTGVVRCEVDVKVGDKVHPFKHSTERHGFILAVGENGAEAIANVENALAKINITVENKA